MKFVRVIVPWLPLAVAVTGICILVYIVAQQNYRQSLNDPQIQMAEDAAAALGRDYTPAAVVQRGELVDISTSLAPWIAVYDTDGSPLEASGQLNGKPPQPPAGVFYDVASGVVHGTGPKWFIKQSELLATGENRLTWQPEPGVRQAIVVVKIPGHGFVVAGRNMREAESRTESVGLLVLAAWLTTLLLTFVLQIFSGFLK